MVTSAAYSLAGSDTIPIFSSPRDLRGALEQVDRQQWSSLPEPQATERYSRRILVDTPQLLVVVARWRAGAQCDLHGHSSSAGLYQVVEGTIEQQSYVPSDGRYEYGVERLAVGDESYLPAGSYHKLAAETDAITVHAYSPRPDDAVSDVEPRDLPHLDAARYHARSTPMSHGNFVMRRAPSTASIEDLAEEFSGRWRIAEDQAYADGGYRLPIRVLEDMRASGILAAPLPRRAGGFGATLIETAHAVTRIACEAPAAALALVMPLGNAATCRIPISAVPLEHAQSLRVNQRWIADQVLRGRILAVANSEPGIGGSLAQTQTSATFGSDGVLRLTGRKTFATIGPDADYFLCAARVANSASTNGGAN